MNDLVIFDCDGVLVDSDRIALRIYAELVEELGLAMSRDECLQSFLGIERQATLRMISQRIGRPVPEAWVERFDAAVYAAFRTELVPMPGIIEVLESITRLTCVASNGSHEKMRFTLRLTGLYEHFVGRIFSADDVSHGKPAPDLFHHAAREMGVSNERCVVVEDSSAGVAAAKAAGMRVLGFAATTPASSLTEADTIFTTMPELRALLAEDAVI